MPEKILWYTLSVSDALKRTKGGKLGLSAQEVSRRQEVHGFNELPKEQPLAWWVILFSQFFSPLILILIIAAIISAALHEWVDVGVIGAAVILNTIIGFVQEFKANKSMHHLRSLVQPKALVVRAGETKEVLARDIVVGDIVLLKTGDKIVADGRVVEDAQLQINESTLTGESMPLDKHSRVLSKGTILAERANMLYAGTHVVAGHGRMLVVAVGLQTEIGKIASLVSETKDVHTPLQDQLARLAKMIASFVVVVTVGVFVLGIARGFSGVDMFEMAIALAVAAIPEGLTVSVTIVLAIGMQRILKKKSLVRRLVASETLGSVSVICSDKTGTLTEGEMRVTKLVDASGDALSLKHDVVPSASTFFKMVELSVLCNDASRIENEDGKVLYRGSPTERALLLLGEDALIHIDALQKKHSRTFEIPFDSKTKFMVTRNKWASSQKFIVKGAPNVVFEFCNKVEKDGKSVSLSRLRRAQLKAKVDTLTEDGLRVLAIGYKHTTSSKVVDAKELDGFTLLGLICLRDPLRKDAKAQIEAARTAGVRTVIITGDHPKTAQAIAKEAGLHAGPEAVVSGAELDDWSDKELEKRVSRISIYARVEPRHKIRIVSAWQARGEVVAMTGDGVNDAPALKIADIGIALGSGTEVAKQSSDLILLDNNLGTITHAIEQGRVMFDNIRKVTVYLLAGSFNEIILISGAILLGLPLPLLPMHILWINLFADSFPNIGLTMESGEDDVMQLKPRGRHEKILNKTVLTLIVIIGVVTNIGFFGLFLWLLDNSADISWVRSMMFVAVSVDSLMYVFSVKSFRTSIFRINPFSNLYLVGGVAAGFGLMLLAVIHPFFQVLFEITPLSLSDWLLLIMMASVKLVVIEILKEWFILRKKRNIT